MQTFIVPFGFRLRLGEPVPRPARRGGERSIRRGQCVSHLFNAHLDLGPCARPYRRPDGIHPGLIDRDLLVAEKWLGTRSDVFNALIQVGAAVALIPLFWPKLVGIVRNWSLMESRDFVAKLVGSFLITVAGGMVLKKLDFELPKTVGPVPGPL